MYKHDIRIINNEVSQYLTSLESTLIEGSESYAIQLIFSSIVDKTLAVVGKDTVILVEG